MQDLPTITAPEVHEWLEQGATLVTVNRRLARSTTDRYGARQVEAGRSAWETPDILPYGAWLERCARNCLFYTDTAGATPAPPADAPVFPVLLRPFQELLLWEQVIRDAGTGRDLLGYRDAARMARDAWRLCIEWRIFGKADPSWEAADPAAFALWAYAFEKRCRRNDWIDGARLADWVREAVFAGRLDLPATVIFSGFDDFSPQAADLVDAFSSKGIRTYFQAFPDREGKAVRCGFADASAELRAAAEWAREKLRENPGARIGIIVNGLAQNRDAVSRVFEETFHPSAMLCEAPPGHAAFNISLGRPLAAFPMVQSALVILDMVDAYPEMEAVHELFLSPYTAGADREFSARARADVWIRESKQPRMPVMQILAYMQPPKGHGGSQGVSCPVLCGCFSAFEKICLDMPEMQTPLQWCRTFQSLLDAFGWPGDRPLDTREYQVLGAWQDALAGFASAGEVSSALSFAGARATLRHVLSETLFQPETPDAGVQVMGLLEAAGEEFDAAWITGLTQTAWPRPPAPNPFIPFSLQREHDLPNATAARELAFARKVTRRVLASADVVVAGFPRFSEDTPLFPSTMLEALPELSPEAVLPGGTRDYRILMAASENLAAFTDATGPPLGKKEKTPGGTGIFKFQAQCPFSAFARYRLGAKPFAFPVNGIDAADRGILVHKVLELVWDRLQNQRRLISEDARTLSALVSESVSTAKKGMAKARPQTFAGRFAAMEQRRLHDLVMAWLEKEAKRASFEVEGSERYMTVEIGGVRISAFADRIDRLENGRWVIIDYKTGHVSKNEWFGERMAEPQLPVYCLGSETVPAGVFFARVKKGDMKFTGIADDESIVPGIRAVADTGGLNGRFGDIGDIVSYWQDKLAAIAGELAAGYAPVRPVSVHKSCRYCHLKPVCRINELVETGQVAV